MMILREMFLHQRPNYFRLSFPLDTIQMILTSTNESAWTSTHSIYTYSAILLLTIFPYPTDKLKNELQSVQEVIPS